MSVVVEFAPSGIIPRAMFNFDAFGIADYLLSGLIRVSVSDTFTYSDYISGQYSQFSAGLYTSGSGEVTWTPLVTSNIVEIASIYSQFANMSFQWVGDFDTLGGRLTANPEDVGRTGASDINITWVYRPDVGYAGLEGAGSDSFLGYVGGASDIFLNSYGSSFAGDFTLEINSRGRQILMHELGHALGLSHPHSAYNNGNPTITADYAATKDLGWGQLGFQIFSAADMYREYFSIMSYDDQVSLFSGSNAIFQAHTPMILDVIALQQVYGEGSGTTGSGNDTIMAGNAGYRTYFDPGGIDTINLSLYTSGAYLQMGVAILGADHLVGVSMSFFDATNTILNGGDPMHLRWFYGEFENAVGSNNVDFLAGNGLDNIIFGQGGSDGIYGHDGNDTLYGEDGNDSLLGENGNDVLDGGPGNDTLNGGAGNDIFVVDAAGDSVTDSSGVDAVVSSIDYGLGGAIENLTLIGNALNGTGNAGGNLIIGNTTNNSLMGLDGNDTIYGGAGNDSIQGDQNFTVLSGNDVILSEGGDDVVFAGPGDDVVALGAGFDVAIGEGGNDAINGEGGNDAIDGGGGDDTLLGWDDQDILFGASGADILYGGNGNDIMMGNRGDPLDGVDGVDLMFGEAGQDTIHGGAGDDGIMGGDGNDVIDGGLGNDNIIGGLGADIMLGSGINAFNNIQFPSGTAGSDNFIYNNVSEAGDSIYGFDLRAGNEDKLFLQPMIGTFTGVIVNTLAGLQASGHLRLLDMGADIAVQVDTDGGGNNYTTLATLVGVANISDLMAANFVL